MIGAKDNNHRWLWGRLCFLRLGWVDEFYTAFQESQLGLSINIFMKCFRVGNAIYKHDYSLTLLPFEPSLANPRRHITVRWITKR